MSRSAIILQDNKHNVLTISHSEEEPFVFGRVTKGYNHACNRFFVVPFLGNYLRVERCDGSSEMVSQNHGCIAKEEDKLYLIDEKHDKENIFYLRVEGWKHKIVMNEKNILAEVKKLGLDSSAASSFRSAGTPNQRDKQLEGKFENEDSIEKMNTNTFKMLSCSITANSPLHSTSNQRNMLSESLSGLDSIKNSPICPTRLGVKRDIINKNGNANANGIGNGNENKNENKNEKKNGNDNNGNASATPPLPITELTGLSLPITNVPVIEASTSASNDILSQSQLQSMASTWASHKDDEKSEPILKYEFDTQYSIGILVLDWIKLQIDPKQYCLVLYQCLESFLKQHTHPYLRIYVFVPRSLVEYFKQWPLSWSTMANFNLRQPRILNWIQCNESTAQQQYVKQCLLFCQQFVHSKNCIRFVLQYMKYNWKCIPNQCKHVWESCLPSGCHLELLFASKFAKQTAKLCTPYVMEMPPSFQLSHKVQHVIGIVPPNHNSSLIDYIDSEQLLLDKLKQCYNDVLLHFYQLCHLPFVIPTVVPILTTTGSITAVSKHEPLPFHLQQLPTYALPLKMDQASGQYNGHWKNALSVYLLPKEKRQPECGQSVYWEDKNYVLVYDRFFKAKFHLLLLPRCTFASISELMGSNSTHIQMIQDMAARGQWICHKYFVLSLFVYLFILLCRYCCIQQSEVATCYKRPRPS
ncbi:hypothetical protein RFI_24735 [Reticulomyxa filosa]|uniref:Uncharacterized protein n=1 Tax=Reticulomyxa filosa TaxID=46433 RepID=X6MF39_RETFI|nr:hypothetical protein RFI_24735 [Reticulomyxa filosa]|eukprot:ETO12638.1 hypothetical protein RFI_24735 [Reticulomyxa filosa]